MTFSFRGDRCGPGKWCLNAVGHGPGKWCLNAVGHGPGKWSRSFHSLVCYKALNYTWVCLPMYPGWLSDLLRLPRPQTLDPWIKDGKSSHSTRLRPQHGSTAKKPLTFGRLDLVRFSYSYHILIPKSIVSTLSQQSAPPVRHYD